MTPSATGAKVVPYDQYDAFIAVRGVEYSSTWGGRWAA